MHRPVRGPDAEAGEGGALERLANRHCHGGVVLECLLQGKTLKHWHCVVPVQLAVNLHAHGFTVRSRCEH